MRTIHPDADLANADWTKKAWDLPPYKSVDFLMLFPDLDAFRKLPVYAHAVEALLIHDDEWVADWTIPVPDIAAKLHKFRRRGKPLVPVSRARPASRLAQRRLASVITKFFARAATVIAASAVAATRQHVKKITSEDAGALDAAMAHIDFSVYNQLPKMVKPILRGAHLDTAKATIQSIARQTAGVAVAVHPREDAFNQVSENAVDYATHRSAEMVGMRYDAKGDLVTNPNPKWAITDTTREGIRSLVQDTIEGKISVIDLPAALKDSNGFSEDRANMIARTEVNMANGAGALAGLMQSGVELKVWLTSGDADVSEECAANEDQGPIPVEDSFESGDDTDPAHPNCRCAVTGYISFDDNEEQT